MEVLKRCLLCEKKGLITLYVVDENGWKKWLEDDPVAIKTANDQRPSGCRTDGIDYIPAVLACDIHEKPPLNFSGF